jgi:ribosomal protein L40E
MVDPEKQRPERLAVVHVCKKCDSASNPPEVNEDVNVTGVVQCRICGHMGPLRIRVVEKDSP